MKAFMDQDFILQTQTASDLYHKFAETTPILDYHCHINPAEIANDRKFDNITQVWLGGDRRPVRQGEILQVGGVCRKGNRQPALSLDAP